VPDSSVRAGDDHRPRIPVDRAVPAVRRSEHVDRLIVNEAAGIQEGRRGRGAAAGHGHGRELRLIAGVDTPEHPLGGESQLLCEHRLPLVAHERRVVGGVEEDGCRDPRRELLGRGGPLVVHRHDAQRRPRRRRATRR
jgi:hypothetical protein